MLACMRGEKGDRPAAAPPGGEPGGYQEAPEEKVGRTGHPGGPELRLAELIAVLSLATDLGMGQPMEHALRTCLLSVRLAERLGMAEDEIADVYYLALLTRAGCTGDSYELGRLFGDDLAAHARLFVLDFARPLEVLADLLRHAGAGRPPWGRAWTAAAALAAGPGAVDALFRASCEVAQGLAGQLGFGTCVHRALAQTFERWDGRGSPGQVSGEEIALPRRVVHVAEDAEVLHRLGGLDGAVAALRRRAGTSHDPAVSDLFRREAPRLFAELETVSAWEAVLAAEPGTPRRLSPEGVDGALRAVAQFADMKSPYTAGHSAGVAALAAGAAEQFGLPAPEGRALPRAALVHDLGRAGVPNGVWDRPGRLTDAEWERVRLHPYYAERVLRRSRALAPLAALAGLHHERLDGSGYHRGAPAGMQPPAARLLAAADAYHAMTEERPHRPALAPAAAAAELRQEVRRGRLDGDAVDAVLRAAGHRVRRRREWPAALSPREVEVLRLLARGLPNRAIARRLVVAEPTVAAHVRHIYDKTGLTTRAGAALFAMQHDLLGTDDPAET